MRGVEREFKLLEHPDWQEHRLYCSQCGGDTNHRVLKGVKTEESYSRPVTSKGDILRYEVLSHDEEVYQVIQCKGCDAVSFRYSLFYDSYTGELESLFPPRHSKMRRKLRGLSELPFRIRRVYEETWTAYSNSLDLLTRLGIRSIVEVVCLDEGIEGSHLFEKIGGLVEEGLLTTAQSKKLHCLREMGNEAAHDFNKYGVDAINDALSITEHLLQTIYLIPATGRDLPGADS